MCLNPRPFFLRPIHGSDVKRDILIELLYPLTRETNPGFCRDSWLQEELHCRVIDTRAVELKVGRNPFERTRAIKHDGAEPSGMGAWTHDWHIAFMPLPLKKCPGLRPAVSN